MKVDDTVLSIDMAPTILALAGLAPPPVMQGKSLGPLLAGEAVEWRDEWFYEHRFEHPFIPKSEGVRGKRWKYVRFYDLRGAGGPTFEQLFDVEKDPFDEHDLARDPAAAPVLEEMRRKCDAWREKAR